MPALRHLPAIPPRGWPLRDRLLFGVLLLLDAADYLRDKLRDKLGGDR